MFSIIATFYPWPFFFHFVFRKFSTVLSIFRADENGWWRPWTLMSILHTLCVHRWDRALKVFKLWYLGTSMFWIFRLPCNCYNGIKSVYFPLVKAYEFIRILCMHWSYYILSSIPNIKHFFLFLYSFISYYKVWVPLIQNCIVLCISRIASRICHGIVFSPPEGGWSSFPDSCFSGLYILFCRRLQTPWSSQDQQPAERSTVWSDKKETKKDHMLKKCQWRVWFLLSF